MKAKNKGIAAVALVVMIALGLIVGAGAGYGFRNQIQKTVEGKTTEEEKNQLQQELDEVKQGQSKFELEGVTTEVNVAGKEIKVEVQSGTASIKELKDQVTSISISDSAEIIFGSEKGTISLIPINAKVHVGGDIVDKGLVATKVIVQKEDVDENNQSSKNKFTVVGSVVTKTGDSIDIAISSANKNLKDKKGETITIVVTADTIIEKNGEPIDLADIVAGDIVVIRGTFADNVYTTTRITVQVEESTESTGKNNSSNSNRGGNNNNAGRGQD